MSDEALREKIVALMEGGLQTEAFPRADTDEQVRAITARLLAANGDLQEVLKISGFTLHTVTHEGMEQPCETCMYYLVHRKWCDLRGIDLPVEPDWSCRLWRL